MSRIDFETTGCTPSVSEHLCEGLQLLLRAATYAEDVKCSPWDMAVEMNDLTKHGLSRTDLRWLICRGYLEHQQEVPSPVPEQRKFRGASDKQLTRKSCFLLTATGRGFARRICTANGEEHHAVRDNGAPNGNGKSAGPMPCWDGERRELRVGESLVKQFKLPSPNQEALLMAFEEDGWPPRIDDPLPPQPDQDPKRRLHDTIKSLNRHQKLRLLQFSGDGTGEGVLWTMLS